MSLPMLMLLQSIIRARSCSSGYLEGCFSLSWLPFIVVPVITVEHQPSTASAEPCTRLWARAQGAEKHSQRVPSANLFFFIWGVKTTPKPPLLPSCHPLQPGCCQHPRSVETRCGFPKCNRALSAPGSQRSVVGQCGCNPPGPPLAIIHT